MEVWRNIPEFEGVYEVSNMGNVKRLSYEWQNNMGHTCYSSERLLSSKKKDFFFIRLSSDGRQKNYCVNRLVYSVFNNVVLEQNMVVVHKDGNKMNCALDNLKLMSKRSMCTLYTSNKNGFTGVHEEKFGLFSAKIRFCGKELEVHRSYDKNECQKIYQMAKVCIEEFDKNKIGVLSAGIKGKIIKNKEKL